MWTVDDAARIRALEAMGVTGVITNDPRLFDCYAPPGAGVGVMKCALRRSTGVNSAMTLPAAAPARIALDFDALYRAARDDVFAYVATLLHDRGAAEDVTALAFERAFRKRKSFDPRARQRASVAVRHRPQRRARRAAPRQAQRRRS